MSKNVVVGLLLGALVGCASGANTRPATQDEAVAGDALAAKMVQAMGGMDAFHKLRRISFGFTVEALGMSKERARIDWDPATNLARIKTGSGDDEVLVWLDCGTKEGTVRVGGKPVTDPSDRRKKLDEAFREWANDTYWLLSPWKVLDAGARRAAVDGMLRISFEEKVGLTPGDTYQYELAADGHPVAWNFTLQSGLRARHTFEDPKVFEGATFYTRKHGGMFSVTLSGMDASATPAPELFTPPK